MVDARRRRTRPAHRRRGRPSSRALRALTAARRHTRSQSRPQSAPRTGRPNRRSIRRRPRRQSTIVRLTPQHLHAGRPQTRPLTHRARSMGRARQPLSRHCPRGTLRPDRRGRCRATRPRSRARRSHRALGDGLSPRLLLAKNSRTRQQGPAQTRSRSDRRSGTLRARTAVSATSKIQLHSRSRRRRARAGCAFGALPG